MARYTIVKLKNVMYTLPSGRKVSAGDVYRIKVGGRLANRTYYTNKAAAQAEVNRLKK
jgi:hypothetical protein